VSSQTPSLTVVLCTYSQRWADLQAAVGSALRQSMPVLEAIVVVDHNATLSEQAQRSLPAARIVGGAGPPGLSGARNTGLAPLAAMSWPSWTTTPWLMSTGRSVCWTAITSRRLSAPAAPSFPPGELRGRHGSPDEFPLGGRLSPSWAATVTGGGPHAIGANMSFRRDALRRSGGFDPSVGRQGANAAGCEETELSIRVREQFPGSTVLLEPRAQVRHTVTVQRASRRYFRARCLAEGRSKAVVSASAGADAALASERTYTARTLPSGVLRGLREAVRGDLFRRVSGGRNR